MASKFPTPRNIRFLEKRFFLSRICLDLQYRSEPRKKLLPFFRKHKNSIPYFLPFPLIFCQWLDGVTQQRLRMGEKAPGLTGSLARHQSALKPTLSVVEAGFSYQQPRISITHSPISSTVSPTNVTVLLVTVLAPVATTPAVSSIPSATSSAAFSTAVSTTSYASSTV